MGVKKGQLSMRYLLWVGFWFVGGGGLLWSQTLTGITVVPSTSGVGQQAIHTITFTHAGTIPSDGVIVFRYPTGFNLTTVSIVYTAWIDEGITFSVDGTGTVLTLRRSGLGDPEDPGHPEIIRLAVVTHATMVGSYSVRVETRQADHTLIEWGDSAPFALQPGPLSTFALTLPSSVEASGVQAGADFTVGIEARDAWGNRVTTFSNAVTLTDLTGTLIVSTTGTRETPTFSSGQWNGNVRITKTQSLNRIHAVYGTVSGASNPFNVLPAALDRFVFDPITSPQTAGTPFSITITAYDAYGNQKTDYTGSVTLTEKTGTLTVPATGTNSTGNFTSGRWMGGVQIIQGGSDIALQASGGGRTGASSYFNVVGGPVNRFTLSNISTQSAGVPFLVTITARDIHGNVATSFSGRVTITHTGSGTLTPTQSGDFSNGVWTGTLRIHQTQTGDRIRVDDGAGHTGESNAFDVISSTVDQFTVVTSIGTQTAGVGFTVTLEARDVYGNVVTSFHNQVVSLRDQTGTLTPQQVTFLQGVWTGTVQITQAMTNNTLVVTGAGKSGTSNAFTVTPASLARFELDPLTSPKTAGTPFPITIRAKDAYGNVVQAFNGSVTLSASSGTVSLPITPTSSGAFASGTRTVNVTLTRAIGDVVISADDGAGRTGQSNAFNVIPAALHRFAIGEIADQVPGVPFTLTVIAQDAYNNTVTTFSGTGNRVNIGHTGTGALSLTQSGDFLNGLWSGAVAVLQTQTSDRITVTRVGGTQTGTSNAFQVIPTTVDRFVFGTVAPTQTAGVGFAVTIRALDAQDNVVSGFNGTVNLTDKTGTNQPKQVTFSGGIVNVSVSITKSLENNTLMATALGKGGESNPFTVRPAVVQSIAITPVASPQIAGNAFSILMTALDAYQNVVTDFTGPVTLRDNTGTLALLSGSQTSGTFSQGRRTEGVMITRAMNDAAISVFEGTVQRGQSNPFNVLPSALSRFRCDPVPDQLVGVPFSITLTAEDAYGNIRTQFDQAVSITDLTGSIRPTQSLNFSAGVVTTGVTVHQVRTANRIRVSYGGITSESNAFHVNPAPGIQLFDFRAVGPDTATTIPSVTTGMGRDSGSPWFLRLKIRNLGGTEARLDSLKLQFIVGGIPRTDYRYQIPTTFWGVKTNRLPGSQVDSLWIPLLEAGRDPGAATIRVAVYLTHLASGQVLSHEAVTNLWIQTPANPVLLQLRPSQPEVTRGQLIPWRVTLHITNTGGSAVRFDTSRTRTRLSFAIGTGWLLEWPPVWSKDWILEGGETDSLRFTILRTPEGVTGSCRIDVALRGVEINTGRGILLSGTTEVVIENPAGLRLLEVTNQAPNSPYVNRGQVFSLLIRLENPGGDAVRDVTVQIISSGTSSVTGSHYIGTLRGGEVFSFTVPVTASNQLGTETFTVGASGFSDNMGLYFEDANSFDKTATATIQAPAAFSLPSVVTTQGRLLGGQKDPWKIKAVVRNTGGADLVLSRPAADSVLFYIDGILQTDYKILPPSGLKGGGLILKPGVTDTLIYEVQTTGSMGGTVTIVVRSGGRDRNDGRVLKGSASTLVMVESEKAFRILSTQVDALNTTEAKNGYVNTGQEFRILAILENGLGYTLRDIDVRLRTAGSSTLKQDRVLIDRLEPMRRDSAWFPVTAASLENRNGETFTARIVSARRENGVPAPIGRAVDSTAQVVIQTPASLSLRLTTQPTSGIVSTDQPFTVTASLVNGGSAGIRGKGRVRIRLPNRYRLNAPSDTAAVDLSTPATWSVIAPSDSSANDVVVVILDRYPLDRNTGNKALVPNNSAQVVIHTIRSRLYVSTEIIAPPGAQDGIVSTGQSFVVRTRVSSQNVNQIKAKIVLPSGYQTRNSLLQNVMGDTAVWQVTAPERPSTTDTLWVQVGGVDALQPSRSITAAPVFLPMVTVNRAALVLTLAIVSPPEAAEYHTVAPGQSFVVCAEVENEGEAGTYGETKVTLTLPEGFSTVDPLTQVLHQRQAEWTLSAPPQVRAAAQIEARITLAPMDENTDLPAYLARSFHTVAISLQSAWLAVSPAPLPDSLQTLTPGQTRVVFWALRLENRGEHGAYPVRLEEMNLEVVDLSGNPIEPASVLRLLEVIDPSGRTVYGRTSTIPEENPVTISLLGPEISFDRPQTIWIRGNLIEGKGAAYFRIRFLGNSGIVAKEAGSGISVLVRDPSKQPFEALFSPPYRILRPEAEARFWNSPNPFGEPGRETTTLYFFVDEPGPFRLWIYSLMGELVRSQEIPESVIRPNEVVRWVWDGRNDKGQEVLNGVYHALLETKNGRLYRTKIAYVK